ncbi:Receptor-like proteiny region transmembrane domain- and RING domain-containing protein 1 [Nymphaea thermarum]|nr:Receptor-like proteiny region transmembrane domain- and RING domain-containing protein 1 [Nymphaea thermarum]
MGLGFPGGHREGYIGLPVLWITIFFIMGTTTANLVLIGKNVSLTFEDMEASFTPVVVGSGECGMLFLGEPLNACIPLTNDVAGLEVSRSPFALIIRGGCTFEDKVRNAQHAGFKAAIIYDDEDTGDLIANRPQAPYVREAHGMSGRLVKALPSVLFTSDVEHNCTSCTCAICLDDYSPGEKLRVLPCRHKFHAVCVDSWLTIWRTFCPVCKRDVRASIGNPPASECTPLLSPAISVPASPSSSAILSSSHSLRTGSPAIRITQASYHSPASSRSQSLASTPIVPYSLRSYGNSSAVRFSRSSADLQNLASQRSRPPYLPSPHSLGLPYLFSPSGSRHGSYLMGSTNASPFCVGSSSRPPCLLHHSESTTSLSPFASAQSLPDC